MRSVKRVGILLGAIAPLLGCGESGSNAGTAGSAGIGSTAAPTTGDSSGGAETTAPSSSSQGGTTSATEAPTSDGTSSGDPTTGDETKGGSTTTGGPVETTGGPLTQCTEVDFLFIVDNSISMGPEQEALVGAFPGFMTTITETLEAGSDYHIMVLDTDDWGRCDTANPWSGQSPDHSTCNMYVENTVFDECDRIIGAGVLHPAGEGASDRLCAPASGKRYIEPGEPDLPGMFSCMATVGLAGHSSERPMDSMRAALDPLNAGTQACNDGFLRDDALLVITFISDDGGSPDAGTPQEWYDDVVAAKGGNADAVVVLGLGPGGDGCGSGGNEWLEFVNLWGVNGIHGPVCGTAQDYVEFFQNSVATIDQACEDIVPG